MLLGKRVVAIDPAGHKVTTDAGEAIGYGKLVCATGGAPRMLPIPGGDLPGVQGVRTRADADAMKAASESAGQIVVIGGGYIGLETAAALRKAEKKVVLLEAQNRVLSRVAGEELSRFYEKEHRRHGVALHLGVCVDAIEGADRVTGVRLSDGTVVPAELVIASIGIVPAVEPLIAAGADCANGVRVDRLCKTSLPDIHAIGDCAAHANLPGSFGRAVISIAPCGTLCGARLRSESCENCRYIGLNEPNYLCNLWLSKSLMFNK